MTKPYAQLDTIIAIDMMNDADYIESLLCVKAKLQRGLRIETICQYGDQWDKFGEQRGL